MWSVAIAAAALVVIVFFPASVSRVRSGLTRLVGAPAASPAISGQWIAHFAFAEQETAEVVVDLGQLSSRWIGEFDVLAFGAENYPVEVSFTPPHVGLHFTGIDVDFEGTPSSDEGVIRGVAKTMEHEQALVFHRNGDVQLSRELLALEAAAGDSNRIATLSPSAVELRERFNAERGRARLILLLSPT